METRDPIPMRFRGAALEMPERMGIDMDPHRFSCNGIRACPMLWLRSGLCRFLREGVLGLIPGEALGKDGAFLKHAGHEGA